MKTKFLLIGVLLWIFAISAGAQTRNVSSKRGIAYGYHTPEDLAALSQGISWWYNWSSIPDAGVRTTYPNYGVEFVPMVWGGTPNADQLVANIPQGVQYLLAFNEPNFGYQSNITAKRAAELWPIFEDVARRRNLKLVSPAMNFCGGNCNQTDPIKYLDEFFANCPNCKVDYIAIHWYDCNPGSLKWYLDLFKKYNKPLWLTEFACGEGTDKSLEAQKRFMRESVALLENDPMVFRYSWFSGRNNEIPNINLLGANGQLTELGQLYVSLPFGNPILPGQLEVENYTSMSGVQTQATNDAGGGQNLGWIDAGDWTEYTVEVKEAGTFEFNYRYASPSNTGAIHAELNGVRLHANTILPSTGGWQNWSTIKVSNINLPVGVHKLRLVFDVAGYNLNYLNVVRTSTPPVADFNLSVPPNCVGKIISFSNASSGTISTYNWNFGTNANPANATGSGPHFVSYNTEGARNVSLTVSGPGGSNTKTQSVAVSTCNTAITIAGIIEAEKYGSMNGIALENTTDLGGGQNIGWIDAGDWTEYSINVSETASYEFNYRIASPSGTGVFHAELDGQRIHANTTTPSTGGWQNWATVKVAGITLTQGLHTLRLVYDAGGMNFNYVDIQKGTVAAPVANFNTSLSSVCKGNSITYSNTSTGSITSYSWNFGTNASPATAVGAGPHTVVYNLEGTKTISLSVTGPGGTSTKSNSVSITACNANLALNKPAVASTSENGGTLASYANDGLANTRWSSAFADPQWIYFDLGKIYSINSVILNWETASAKSYQIQVSNDKINWTSIYTTTSGVRGITNHTVSGAGQYVRIYGTQRNTGYGYSLYEVEVYGTEVTVRMGMNSEEEISTQPLFLFPNPFDISMYIQTTRVNEIQSIVIYNNSGFVVEQHETFDVVDGKIEIGRELENGLYMLQIIRNNASETFRIIKNK